MAAILGAPVGVAGGLLGLGGAEFRLPILKAYFGATAHRAISLNLAVSLVTLASTLAIRSLTAPVVDPGRWALPVAGLAAGATVPTLAAGILRHRRAGNYSSDDLRLLILPMGIGSVIGSLAGGALVPYAPAAALKLILGSLLIVSAWKVFATSRAR